MHWVSRVIPRSDLCFLGAQLGTTTLLTSSDGRKGGAVPWWGGCPCRARGPLVWIPFGADYCCVKSLISQNTAERITFIISDTTLTCARLAVEPAQHLPTQPLSRCSMLCIRLGWFLPLAIKQVRSSSAVANILPKPCLTLTAVLASRRASGLGGASDLQAFGNIFTAAAETCFVARGQKHAQSNLGVYVVVLCF